MFLLEQSSYSTPYLLLSKHLAALFILEEIFIKNELLFSRCKYFDKLIRTCFNVFHIIKWEIFRFQYIPYINTCKEWVFKFILTCV